MLLKMKVGLSGPEISLAPGDEHECADEAEAQRLIDAGFAELPDAKDGPATPPEQPATPAAAKPKAAAPKQAKSGA